MSQYKRGRRSEYYVKNKLEKYGHTVYRIAGSKPVDLVSFYGNIVFIHEVKKTAYKEDDWDTLRRKVLPIQMTTKKLRPVLWYKEQNRWQWKTVPFKDREISKLLP